MQDAPVFAVSELTATLKDLLGTGFGAIRVRGEVGSFTPHRSGHWYFTLKDAGAVLNCVMFRGSNRFVDFQPRIGDALEVFGGLDVYGPYGRYNLVVRSLQKGGRGDLHARFEALKKKLAAEGLFDVERKRPLPALPKGIGIATSTSGAAIRDMIRVLGDRFPGIPIFLAGCRVQGAGAALEIAAALDLLAADGRSDVLLVGRGGGAYEDLWAFNEEPVIRAIARCPLPVISAVGHESDVTLADLVADVRAATPSHAAELVVPERSAVLAAVNDALRRLIRATTLQTERRRAAVHVAALKDPRRRINDARLRCDQLADQLSAAARRFVQTQRRHRLGRASSALDALSPLRVLDRGYAIVHHDAGILRNAKDVGPGDSLEIRLGTGRIAATVAELA
jgi:exodeoxyribonuclease VII large subunit